MVGGVVSGVEQKPCRWGFVLKSLESGSSECSETDNNYTLMDSFAIALAGIENAPTPDACLGSGAGVGRYAFQYYIFTNFFTVLSLLLGELIFTK
jgi:hypothetical protein